MTATTIRQNPPTSAAGGAGETCPIHGRYDPPSTGGLRRRAETAAHADPELARRLLAEATLLRRTCPECGGPTLTGPAWAARVRELACCPICGQSEEVCRCL